MKPRTIIAIMMVAGGCVAPAIKSVPPERAVVYLDGIAHARLDECGETYKLIYEYRDGAVPVVLKALDLYANPSNAPSARCRILNGVSWAYRLNAETTSNVVDEIMIKATNSPNPEISGRGRKWVEWREEEKRKTAEQRAPLPPAPWTGSSEGAR